MCILFLYVAAQPCQKLPKTSLKLVLASNRDEYYSRPTFPLCFWESNKDIIAGQDAQEGGTWLGMTQSGKIAALLNITGGTAPIDPDNPKKSRGFLTTDFLRSTPDVNGWTYCNNLYKDPDLAIHSKVNLFNLVTIDVLGNTDKDENSGRTNSPQKVKTEPIAEDLNSPSVTYLTNVSKVAPTKLFPNVQTRNSQAFAFGNSVYEKPFVKVSTGCEQFENIINKYTKDDESINEENKLNLKTDLLEFLKSTEKHFPDPQMELQFKASEPAERAMVQPMSSRFVRFPQAKYGTRTHSIIIVDSENRAEYYESTLQEPIDIENPIWKDSKYEFTLSHHISKL